MTITVRGPNGITVNFPDGTDQSTIDAAMREAAGQSGPQVGVAEDAAKGVGSGLATGAMAFGGLPGDVATGIGAGMGKIGSWFGATPETQENIAQTVRRGIPMIGPASNTSEIQSAVTGLTGFTPYEPQTTPGKFANTAAEFVPGAVAFGGLGTGIKGAISAGTRLGVVPGLASEAAGQATEGTALEPYARTGAAVVSGGLAAVGRNKPALPAVDALRRQSQALYKQAHQQGVTINPDSFTRLRNELVAALNAAGIDKGIQPKAFAAANRILKAQTTGVAPSLQDMDIFRQLAGGILKDIDSNERRIAGLIVSKIDDFMATLGPDDVLAGDPATAVPLLKQARALWVQKSKAETIENIFEAAKDQVGANYTAAGMQTALRQKFRALNAQIRAGKAPGYSQAEKDAIERVVRGGSLENMLRFFGKFAPRGFFSGTGIIGATYVNPVLGMTMLAGSEGAKAASTSMGLKNADMVNALVRGVKPTGPATIIDQRALAAALANSSLPVRQPAR